MYVFVGGCGPVSMEYTERVLTFRYAPCLAHTSLTLNRQSELRETNTIEERSSAIEITDPSSSAFDNDPIGVRTRRQPR